MLSVVKRMFSSDRKRCYLQTFPELVCELCSLHSSCKRFESRSVPERSWDRGTLRTSWLLRTTSPGPVPHVKGRNEDKTLWARKMLKGLQWVGKELSRRKGCLSFRYQRDLTTSAQLSIVACQNTLKEANSVFISTLEGEFWVFLQDFY